MGDLGQAVNMLFVMMAIVFLILILLIVIIKLMGIVLGAFHNREKGPSGPSSPSGGAGQGGQKNQPNLIVPAPEVESGIPEEVVAVIAAAVAAMDGSAGAHSVICSVSRAKGQKNAWSMAGLLKSTNPFSL